MSRKNIKARKAPRRISKRVFPMVNLHVEGFEGAFSLPDIASLPFKFIAQIEDSPFKQLKKLGDYGVDSETVEVILEMNQKEIEELLASWGKASHIGPK